MTARVLLVDDPELAHDMRALFEETGAVVEVCQGPEEAERSARARPFDLAVLDVGLDGPNLLDLVPRLRKASPSGEVILVIERATLDSALAAVRLGVFAYLPKPFDPSDLLRVSAKALAQVALRRESAELSRELARSEALHRAIFDAVDELIVGLDASHRVRMWNRSAALTTGWSSEEVIGQNACQLLLAEAHRPPMDRALATAASGVGAEVRTQICTKFNGERVIAWSLRPLTPEGSTTPMVVLAGSDLTETLELRARAAEAEAMAAMGRLTSALAHEIRNPLNAAKLQLELLRRGARKLGEEETRVALEKRATVVDAELTRLSHLLDDFIGFARPEHVSMEPVALGPLVEEVASTQRRGADDAGATLEVRVADDLPIVFADEGRIRHALVNLIVNALEAVSEGGGGHVSVVAERREDWVELRVEDDGPGLAQPQSELFQPFVTTKKAGTGLGLPIVKKIVDLHEGVLEIGPRVGGGTVARLSLPATDAEGHRVRGAPP
jgi:PAS domain S-box-containing protein